MADRAVDPDLAALLDYIKRARGFDLTGYKSASLSRRIAKRIGEVRCSNYADYQDHLEVHPHEFERLFDAILINVTSFFRDVAAWEFLADEILPRIVSAKSLDEPVRVWSAGCASGEETYSLAMVLCDALGTEQFRSRVKIYGTDADDQALSRARQATYDLKELEQAPAGLVERFFEDADGTGARTFRRDLRRSLIFGRHDLVHDAPISRLDLLVCRNTLMYLNAETQARIIERFNFALGESGYLFLGKAETLLTHSSYFTPVELPLRIFAKANEIPYRAQPAPPRRAVDGDRPVEPDLDALAFDETPVALIVVDAANHVVGITASGRALFGLRSRDLGTPLQDLELSYRPVELRSLMADAFNERRLMERKSVRWPDDNGATRVFDVAVTPLARRDGSLAGASIAFHDVTRYHLLHDELEHSNRDLEAAYEELQSTNEELETTNEELQSTIEELATTNGELQSTNEVLETINEELQSANDHLRRGEDSRQDHDAKR